MKLPKYKSCPVSYWMAEGFTQFVNGFIAGLGGGTVVGVGMGATTSTTELGEGLTPFHRVLISVASLSLTAIGNGLKRIIVWHDQNPFPNPWPRTDQSTMVADVKAPDEPTNLS